MQPLPLVKIRLLQSAVRRRRVLQRAALVTPHQAGVADNVCSDDRRQFSLLTGHGNFPRLCFGSWQARARYAINGW
jgi:hypothetical protein